MAQSWSISFNILAGIFIHPGYDIEHLSAFQNNQGHFTGKIKGITQLYSDKTDKKTVYNNKAPMVTEEED